MEKYKKKLSKFECRIAGAERDNRKGRAKGGITMGVKKIE